MKVLAEEKETEEIPQDTEMSRDLSLLSKAQETIKTDTQGFSKGDSPQDEETVWSGGGNSHNLYNWQEVNM